MRVLRFAVISALLVVAGPFSVMRAQQSSPYAQRLDQAKQAKQESELRQKQLISDSDKLVTLSVELREEIRTSTPDTLSADSLKKAVKIQKLAHSILQQMKY
jgi:hypothetical protein